MALRSPAEIARDTFKELAARRLQPSPDNYRRIYDEVAGSSSPAPFPAQSLRQIARVLPAQTPVQKRLLAQFEAATESFNWQELQRTIVGYANLGLGMGIASMDEPAPAPIDTPPDAQTSAARQANPTQKQVATIVDAAAASDGMAQDMREQVARLILGAMPAVGDDDERLTDQAAVLIKTLRAGYAAAAMAMAMPPPPLQTQLGNFAHRLLFAAEQQAAIREGLLRALQLVFRNIAELSVDERWLHGQAQALMEAATPPLDLRRLDELQARLKDVIFKQTEAKAKTVEAQEQVRAMLASFIDRLGTVTEESSIYYQKMEGCATKIASAATLDEIAPVMREVLTATRSIAIDAQRNRDELVDLREVTESAQASVNRLQQELDNASLLARHDPLTGALNRKGLDDTFAREISRARRTGTKLCVAMLDVDDFKAINDRLGHNTGDAALLHLSQVTRTAMRPNDSLGRWGGEEFVVVMPDTEANAGLLVMQRLQRELTRRFFLKDNEKVLITFSAGVTELVGTEAAHDALSRADNAMYLAKRAGKNRVMLG